MAIFGRWMVLEAFEDQTPTLNKIYSKVVLHWRGMIIVYRLLLYTEVTIGIPLAKENEIDFYISYVFRFCREYTK